MPCEDCDGPGAELVPCPFAEDVDREIVLTWLCDGCHGLRADEI